MNLVRNPGFESVIGPGSGGVWGVADASTTNVAFWTRTSIYVNSPQVWTTSTAHPAYQGTKYAALPGLDQTLVGTLSASTIPGVTYILSARVKTGTSALPGAVEIRLRRSSNGDESPSAPQAVSSNGSWVLVTTPVTSNVIYDRVALRFYQPDQSGGYVDDVHVCRVGVVSYPPLWTWLVVGVGLIVVILGGLAWALGRRRGRTIRQQLARLMDVLRHMGR